MPHSMCGTMHLFCSLLLLRYIVINANTHYTHIHAHNSHGLAAVQRMNQTKRTKTKNKSINDYIGYDCKRKNCGNILFFSVRCIKTVHVRDDGCVRRARVCVCGFVFARLQFRCSNAKCLIQHGMAWLLRI